MLRPQWFTFLRPDKLILVVRDPVDRIVSSWAQILENRVKKGLPPPNHTLEDKILNKAGRVNRREKSVRTSTYLKSYRQWYKVPGKYQCLLIILVFSFSKAEFLLLTQMSLLILPGKGNFNSLLKKIFRKLIKNIYFQRRESRNVPRAAPSGESIRVLF